MGRAAKGAMLAGVALGVLAAAEPRPAAADAVGGPIVRQMPPRSAQSTPQTGLGQPGAAGQALDQAAGVDTAAPATTPTLHTPFGVAVDSAGQIYVANLTGGVTVYSKQRQLIATITTGVNAPVGLAVGFGGNIYVANNGGNNVTIYNSGFSQIGTISDPTLQYPTGIFVDSVNDIWVMDGALVHLYLDNGAPISSGPAGGATAIGPWGSTVTVWGAYANTLGLVEYVQNIGEALHNGIGYTVAYPLSSPPGGEAQDAIGQQYTTDPNNNQLVIYNAQSTGYFTLGTASPGYGIAVDAANKRFYVAEPGVNQVVVYSTIAPYKILGVIK